jgi:hypothetical protein
MTCTSFSITGLQYFPAETRKITHGSCILLKRVVHKQDKNAIAVLHGETRKQIGFVAKKNNQHMAPLLDAAGNSYRHARITRVMNLYRAKAQCMLLVKS